MPAIGAIRMKSGHVERWNGVEWERVSGREPLQYKPDRPDDEAPEVG
jgi:hypothetical protein